MTNGTWAIVWLVISVVLFLIEGVTVQLLCVWFAVGALLAMAAAALGAPFWAQLLVFLVASVAVLAVGRRFVRERLQRGRIPTNADQVVGLTGVVREEIDNLLGTGRVTANGLDWTARAGRDDMRIPVGEEVRVLRIEGVKLIVEPITIHERK